MRLIHALALGLCLVGPAFAVDPSERLADPVLEQRARALSTDLRCLVCQDQSIDVSDAQLARDLRGLVRERIAAGDSDAAVVDFLVARYGDFVLLRPRTRGVGLLLWGLPPALVVIGGLGLWLAYRRRAAAPAQEPLTADEEAVLARLATLDDERTTY